MAVRASCRRGKQCPQSRARAVTVRRAHFIVVEKELSIVYSVYLKIFWPLDVAMLNRDVRSEKSCEFFLAVYTCRNKLVFRSQYIIHVQ